MTRTLSLTSSYNLDLEPLGPCNSEPFKIESFKIFAVFTGKHLCWGLFLKKLQTFRLPTFLKSDSNTGVSCGYCRIFKNTFYYTTPPVSSHSVIVALLLQHVILKIVSLSGKKIYLFITYLQQSQSGCLFFDFAHSHAFNFNQKFTQNVAQIILYYHVTKQFLPCLN